MRRKATDDTGAVDQSPLEGIVIIWNFKDDIDYNVLSGKLLPFILK